ncbi:MAG: YciI family protein [Hyphomonadaceae bacterium]
MQYALIVFETPDDFERRDDPLRAEAYAGAHAEFLAALKEAGAAAQSVVGGAGLQAPHTATTLRKRGGSRQVVDGPYSDTKEQMGGIYLIEAPDLDAALSWAERCPTASTGAVEIRPTRYPQSR